jgi:hypothetical protein
VVSPERLAWSSERHALARQAENFLLEAGSEEGGGEGGGAPRVVVADFGVAKLYADEEEGYTARDRGTECVPRSNLRGAGPHRCIVRRRGALGHPVVMSSQVHQGPRDAGCARAEEPLGGLAGRGLLPWREPAAAWQGRRRRRQGRRRQPRV